MKDWNEYPKDTEMEKECRSSCATCMWSTWNIQAAPDGMKDRCTYPWEGEQK